MKLTYQKVKSWVERKSQTIKPGEIAIKGAQRGLLYFSLAAYALLGIITIINGNDPLILFLLIGILLGTVLASLLFSYIFQKFISIPKLYRWTLIGSIPLLLISSGFSEKILLYLLIVIPSLGAAIAVMLKGNFKQKTKTQRVITLIGLLVGAAGIGMGIDFMYPAGFEVEKPLNAALETGLELSELPDPSLQGPYTVQTLFYGSGEDPHRKEFGESVSIKSPRVDGTPFLDEWEGFGGWYRSWYWGFDYKELPLNAQVWYPEGEGPFPLVLIVHGNHPMQDYSDVGYGYLGELMASKGYIFASVDENFLNGSWSDIFGGLSKENDARAWILLEHLKLWHTWNEDSEHPFFGKLDTENIALIGHSRGGEAMGHAAAFNQLSAYPDDASINFDYNFNLRAVIAIAPVDGQYQPGRTRTSFENVNYLVIHGAQDADVTTYSGARQYERIHFTDSLYHYKAGLYIYGANHGQFNTSWGNNDKGLAFTRLLNLEQLLPAQDQEKIAQVYISAFLDASLKNKQEYLPLFTDARLAKSYLPATIYLNQFEDSRTQYISRFDEDLDIKSTPWDKKSISAEHLSVWKEANVKIKNGVKDTRAVYLGWDREEERPDTATFTLNLPKSQFSLDTNSVLTFSLAHASGSTFPKGKRKWVNEDNLQEEEDEEEEELEEEDSEEDEDDPKKQPLNFTIELIDQAGERVKFPLSDFSLLQRVIKVKIMKEDFIDDKDQSESVFQTFPFPLNNYLNQNPNFNLASLSKVQFRFNKTEKGLVILDNIGFTESWE